jgi:hypothetical protein
MGGRVARNIMQDPNNMALGLKELQASGSIKE